VNPETDQLVYRYVSGKKLPEVVVLLLQYSNNFMANQLLLCCGARQYGPPATLTKGLRAVQQFLSQHLDIHDIKMVEGSGLSKSNRISAVTMSRVLAAFSPDQGLMRHEDNEYYKTGNLTDVSTRAGYMTSGSDRRYQYVIMFNSPEKDAGQLIPGVRRLIRSSEGCP
jgi:D-alanyl-D-alanine carboxypeptidase/D-alanyl-D-alanine-endopeptidase (penicillin-binding protein 4)